MAHRIVIVGGVAAGASAATRARRLNEQAEIVIFEKSGYVSFANCGLPYHVGNIIKKREALLLQTPQRFKERFNIDVHVNHEVTRIDLDRRCVEVHDRTSGQTRLERFDRLILTPGASPIVPPVAGVDAANVFVLRNIEDMDRIRAYLDDHAVKRAAVVGAGFIGLEGAEVLVHRQVQVDLIELANQVLPPLDADMASYVERELIERGVSVHLGKGMTSLEVADGVARAVVLPDGSKVPTDMVLMSIGVRPNTELAAQAGLELGERGGIKIDDHLRTSDPHVLAAGDAVEITHTVSGDRTVIPLAGPANKHGRLAGEIAATGQWSSATHKVPEAPSAAGTAIVKVFGINAALTGLSLKAAEKAGFDAQSVLVRRGHHVGYYPGSQAMTIKLIFDAPTRRVLGAQIVGGEGVDRRIDVIATTIHFKGTVDDLAHLDLAYAPQFGAAKDPVHIAAFVADNQIRGLVKHLTVADLEQSRRDQFQLVDVRTAGEFQAGTIPGAVHIELDQLRARASELSRKRPVLLFCQVGQRGYVAARILMNSGRADVHNLAGGYHAYLAVSRK